jgi:hypothetical protein
VAKIAAKKTEVEKMALEAVDRFIDSGAIEQKVREHLAEQLGPPFGDVPASSA